MPPRSLYFVNGWVDWLALGGLSILTTIALVGLGGATDGAAIGAAAAAVRRALPDAALDLAVGPFSPAPAEAPEGASMHRGLRSLRDRLRKASPVLADGFAIADIDSVYDEMVALRARLQSRTALD